MISLSQRVAVAEAVASLRRGASSLESRRLFADVGSNHLKKLKVEVGDEVLYAYTNASRPEIIKDIDFKHDRIGVAAQSYLDVGLRWLPADGVVKVLKKSVKVKKESPKKVTVDESVPTEENVRKALMRWRGLFSVTGRDGPTLDRNEMTVDLRHLGRWRSHEEDDDYPEWQDHATYEEKFTRFIKSFPWGDKVQVDVSEQEKSWASFVVIGVV